MDESPGGAVLRWFSLCLLLFAACSAPSGENRTAERVPRTRTLPGLEASAFPYVAPDAVGLDGDELEALVETVVGQVAAGRLVGAEIMVVKSGRTVLHEAVGWSDREAGVPLQRGSIHRIRSMTKPVLGTAVLMLVDEGRLSLDDRVADILPSFDREGSRAITIRELLTYTSGLRDYGFFESGLPKDPDEYGSLRALIDDVGAVGPLEPRGVFHYGGGSGVLGAVVAEVSGMPVERFFERRILQPLAMDDTHTFFEPGVTWAGRMNATWRWRGEEVGYQRYWDPSMPQRYRYFRGAGGLYSTVQDYARFVAMWIDKGRVGEMRLLQEETVEAALRPLAGGQYGMHWKVPRTPIVDGMPLMFGHSGSDGTLAIAFPGLDASVFFFAQSRGPLVWDPFWYRLARLPSFAGHVASRWHAKLSTADDMAKREWEPDQAERHVGTYVGSTTVRGEERMLGGWIYEVWREGDSLVATLSRRGMGLSAVLPPRHQILPSDGGGVIAVRWIGEGRIETFPDVEIRFTQSGEGPISRVEIQHPGPQGDQIWSLARRP